MIIYCLTLIPYTVWYILKFLSQFHQRKSEDCTYSIEEIQTAISIIDSNTYHVLVRSGPMLQDFVCGVYTRAAMVNHSCRPNTRPIFRGKSDRTMSVIAIEDIEAGEEITTSYLEPFYTTMQRRALLKRGKHFDCCCKRYYYHKINEIQHIRCFRLFCILRPTDYVD